MPFERRSPHDAVTLAWLVEKGLDVGLHCFPCGRHVVVKVQALPFALETEIPTLAGRFKCTRCGSTKTEARPEWPSEGSRLKGAYVAGA